MNGAGYVGGLYEQKERKGRLDDMLIGLYEQGFLPALLEIYDFTAAYSPVFW